MSGRLTSRRFKVDESPEAVADFFQVRQWGDGLPVVPPTEDRVLRVLGGAPPERSLGAIPSQGGRATLEKLAINAVMAGCRPEYFPVVVAAVAAMLEPEFNLSAIQSTTHPCAPLAIVNGPIRKEVDINSGAGVFGPGWRANATIGRAIRLILLNVGGARPGPFDKATQGQPSKYSYCMAENEEANPWEPFHLERGYPRETSTVTVVAVENPHNVNDHVSTRGANVMTTACDTLATMGANNTYFTRGEVMLVLCPEHAAILHRDGWSKEDVKEFVFSNARLPYSRLKLGGMAGLGEWPAWFEVADEDALLPIVRKAADVLVLVAGGAGKHSSCMQSFGLTRSVTRPIEPLD